MQARWMRIHFAVRSKGSRYKRFHAQNHDFTRATFSNAPVSIRVYRKKMLTKKKIVVVIGIIVAILISFYTGVFGISTAA